MLSCHVESAFLLPCEDASALGVRACPTCGGLDTVDKPISVSFTQETSGNHRGMNDMQVIYII